MAGELGFEPRMNESESLVLPLHHSPTCQPSTTCPTDERYYSVVCLRCQAIFKLAEVLHVLHVRRPVHAPRHVCAASAGKRRKREVRRPDSAFPCKRHRQMFALDEPRIILGRQFKNVVALEADNRNARRIGGIAFEMDGQFGLHAADADARCDKPPRHLVNFLVHVRKLKRLLPFCPSAARSFGGSGRRNVSGPPDADSAYGRRTAREK